VTATHAGVQRRLIRIADLTGSRVPDELHLEDANAVILRHADDGSTRYVAALDTPLGRRALMDVLYALAPYKAHGPDRFSRVLDNWQIYDRALTGGGASNSLFQQHVKGLGDNWRIFAEHRAAFMSTFADTSETYRVAPVVSWETTADGKRRWLLDSIDTSPFQASSVLHYDSLVGLVMLAYLQPALTKSWPAWRPLIKGGKSNYIGPASVPMMALLHRRSILNSRFIHAVEAVDFEQEV
jgi:hypothetical protein